MQSEQNITDPEFKPRKPPMPRHPRIYKRLRFWVEIAHEMDEDGQFYRVKIEAEGLDIAGEFRLEFVRWPTADWLNAHIEVLVQAWAEEYWSDIQAAIDRKALERQQEREFWATRGARGQQRA